MLIMAKEVMEEKEIDNKGETSSAKHAFFFLFIKSKVCRYLLGKLLLYIITHKRSL